ncbi:BrnT family toxin [Microvirga lenta]|uniref:BrnT family toxin n=1 Tax=Microvirga lenta TaxID=2881337 RepID=UPI001CFE2964|nr:BrnT family toxin [Microvirga lenta]MCB5173712.1 BrnT family toxin [Microvirga lenta]
MTGGELNFDWDERKRRSNIEKHGIDFLDAIEVFGDPDALSFRSRAEHEEDRYLIIGRCKGRVIAVIYTWRGETVRVISARMARREERQRYGP